MSDKKIKKETNLKLKDVTDEPAKDIEFALNAIKDNNIKNGIMPKSPSILVQNFAGKILRRTKSVYLNGRQFFVNSGTCWEDIDAFHRRHITFSEEDFESKK